MAFVDLEKAFDRVPREVARWTLRYLGVDERTVSVIRAMYENATTKVRLNGGRVMLTVLRWGRPTSGICSQSTTVHHRVEACLQSSGKACLWNCFMQMISF